MTNRSAVYLLIHAVGHAVAQALSANGLSWLLAAETTERVVSRVQPGSIMLFHNATEHTPEALPEILEELISQGCTVVPISKLVYTGECGTDYTIDHTGRQFAA